LKVKFRGIRKPKIIPPRFVIIFVRILIVRKNPVRLAVDCGIAILCLERINIIGGSGNAVIPFRAGGSGLIVGLASLIWNIRRLFYTRTKKKKKYRRNKSSKFCHKQSMLFKNKQVLFKINTRFQ